VNTTETELRFEPIDLDSAAEMAIAFRADAFVCSFGSADRFLEADGKGHERYLAWLRERTRSIPGSCVHVWSGATVIGQMELGRFKGVPEMGYVNLYYLIPAFRNRGLGHYLDEYATAFLSGLGFQGARLNVSPTNRQAMRFYLKNGWRDLGPSQHPHVHVMDKKFVATG
jgi:GNAT superfamily N-acetyltransferase